MEAGQGQRILFVYMRWRQRKGVLKEDLWGEEALTAEILWKDVEPWCQLGDNKRIREDQAAVGCLRPKGHGAGFNYKKKDPSKTNLGKRGISFQEEHRGNRVHMGEYSKID